MPCSRILVDFAALPTPRRGIVVTDSEEAEAKRSASPVTTGPALEASSDEQPTQRRRLRKAAADECAAF